jgi:hypothetical protein
VWHLSFILKLKCHEVIMSLIRLSHTNEVQCKRIPRDGIRCTRAMKHQMHDINVVDLASQHQCDDKFFKLCRTKVQTFDSYRISFVAKWVESSV